MAAVTTKRSQQDRSSRSYAEIVRMRMNTTNNPSGQPISIRMAEKALGYSYEHIRRLVRGVPVQSRDLSDRMSELLGLDPEEMWKIACTEKAKKKYGELGNVVAPNDDIIQMMWPKLNSDDKERVRRLVLALADVESTVR